MPWRMALYERMSGELSAVLRGLPDRDWDGLEEIRAYANRPVQLRIDGITRETTLILQREGMDELLASLSGYALYSCESQLAMGYIPLPGGHRAGVCGRMTTQGDGTSRMCGISSVCIRVARHIPGASVRVRPFLLTDNGRPMRVLLLGAPGCGKTTVLRDAALYLSDKAGFHVAVADEREELFASIPAGEGLRLDVMSGCAKAEAFSRLLRAMAPQVVVTDEIGREEDALAIEDAARCGAGVLASAHADGLHAIMKRPMLRRLFDIGAFERYIHLGRHGRVLEIWDENGECMTERVFPAWNSAENKPV